MTFQALGFSVSHTAPVNVPFASKLSREHSVRLMNAYVNSIESDPVSRLERQASWRLGDVT